MIIICVFVFFTNYTNAQTKYGKIKRCMVQCSKLYNYHNYCYNSDIKCMNHHNSVRGKCIDKCKGY